MKKGLFLIFLLLMSIVAGCSGDNPNKVVATVDGKKISNKDIMYYEDKDIKRENIIEDLVLREVILLEAKKEDISISNEEIKELKKITMQSIENDKTQKEGFQKMASKYKLEVNEFIDTIWTEQTKKDLIVSKYLNKHMDIKLGEGSAEDYQKIINAEHEKIRKKLISKYEEKIIYNQ